MPVGAQMPQHGMRLGPCPRSSRVKERGIDACGSAAGRYAGLPTSLDNRALGSRWHTVARSSGGANVNGASVASSGAPKKGGKGKRKKEDNPYSETVLLPQTDFNMRANSKVREPELQSWWTENKIYERLVERNEGDYFTLHDGPPYANGTLHLGHALNKVLKDIIVKYKLLQGRKASFVPGWDCHGLPIELKVLQSLDMKTRKSLTPMKMRAKAKSFALKTIEEQAGQFQRYGVWGNFNDRYQTLDPAYEAAQLEVFGKMFLQGNIYRGLKPVHWSPSSRTALAEAELEYPEGHKSRSIYVALDVVDMSDGLAAAVGEGGSGAPCALAIWTTTPWTIPANLAVAVNSNITYAVVRDGTGRLLIVADDLKDALAAKFGCELEPVATLKGADLEGCKYRHPIAERTSPVVIGGEYITTESGTGLVHTAPGHGQDDFVVGQKYGLPVLSPVDDAGNLTAEAGAEFEGLNVLGDANEAIVKALEARGCLLLEEMYEHKYPYDWRTKKPTIFRATEQWFASIDDFKEDALKAIDSVEWIPAAGIKRITAMTSDRSDWCISRQRKWGVPIPVFYRKDTKEPIVTKEILDHVTGIIRERGSDAWFELPVADLLPESLRGEADDLIKGEDTMDVWFDSGSSWAGVTSSRDYLKYPADMYLEGSDQHRGWFQSSLLTSVAVNGCAPYKTVLTHGFVLDEKGAKMSKSLGNIIDPKMIIEGGNNQKKDPAYGADTLRLWVSSVDYSSDVLIGPSILKQTSEVYRKLRGSLRFMLGNVHDFGSEDSVVPYAELPAVDRYMLHILARVEREVHAAYESFQFYKVFQILNRFNVTDLSNFYLDIVKDRLYIREAGSFERRSCQTVLRHILEVLLPLVAPILPHLAEDAYQNLPFGKAGGGERQPSVFLSGHGPVSPEWTLADPDLKDIQVVREIRSEMQKALEQARRDKVLGSSLEARIGLHTDAASLSDALARFGGASNGVDELRYLFIVSQVEILEERPADEPSMTIEVEGEGAVAVYVGKAQGQKCARCWNFSTQVGEDAEHPTLCERCVPVLKNAQVAAA